MALSVQDLWLHTATVEPYLGAGSTGDTWGSPVTIPGLLDDTVVLQGAAAQELTATGTSFYCDLVWEASFPVKSRVTVGGRVMRVQRVRRADGQTLLADVTHLAVDLT